MGPSITAGGQRHDDRGADPDAGEYRGPDEAGAVRTKVVPQPPQGVARAVFRLLPSRPIRCTGGAIDAARSAEGDSIQGTDASSWGRPGPKDRQT